jgi:putative membrane protein
MVGRVAAHSGTGVAWSGLDFVTALVLVAAALAYGRGWWRLHRRHPDRLDTAHLAAYLAGIALLWAALLSRIDRLADDSLTLHMTQHLLLMMAPVALLAATPLPTVLWGAPDGVRHGLADALHRGALPRRIVTHLATPFGAWLAAVCVLVGWHDPGLYDAALRYPMVHALEHLTLFATATLFWWHALRAAPRLHPTLGVGARAAYVLSMAPVAMFLGASLAFAREPLYPAYVASHLVPGHQVLGLDAISDQAMGGALMWIGGGMMYVLATLGCLAADLSAGRDEVPTQRPAAAPS